MKPIVEQEETESRRLWKEVTAGLKFNNIDKATNAKAYVEQRQRDEAKYRKENNIRWETKVCLVMFTDIIIIILFLLYFDRCSNRLERIGYTRNHYFTDLLYFRQPRLGKQTK